MPNTPNTTNTGLRSGTKSIVKDTTNTENFIEPPTPSRAGNSSGIFGSALSFVAEKAMNFTTGMSSADIEELLNEKKKLESDIQLLILRAQEADRKERQWTSSFARLEADSKQKEDKLLAENAKQARQLEELKESINQIRMGANEATKSALVKREELFNRFDNELTTALQEKQMLQSKLIEIEASLNEAHQANERASLEHTQQITQLTNKITEAFELRGKAEAEIQRYQNQLEVLKNDYHQKFEQLNTDGSTKLNQELEKIHQLQTKIDELEKQNTYLDEQIINSHQEHTEIEEAYHTINQEYTIMQNTQSTMVQHASTALSTVRNFRTEMNDFRSTLTSQLSSTFNEFTQQANILTKRVRQAEKDAEEANKRYHREQTERRNLHNKLSELRGNIRVFARIRPFLSKENETIPIVKATGNQELVVAEAIPEGGLTINSKGRVLESKT